jgi:hypothetical protein
MTHSWTMFELLIANIEAAIARGCRHYSEGGELLATTRAVLECLQREGFVTVEEPSWRLMGYEKTHQAGGRACHPSYGGPIRL